MGLVEPDDPRARLLPRARRILARPSSAWDEIAEEPTSARDLFLRYVAPLAALPPVCGALGVLAFGFNVADVRVRPSPVGMLLEAAVSYGFTLASVALLALLVNGLAPAFGGVRDPGRAFRLVAYSGTAAWAAGVLFLYPSLEIPAGLLGGLYSLYTLYLGLPKLMRVPEERRLTFYAAVLLAILMLAVLTAAAADRAGELGGPLALA